jgi:Family of unknown function (DUF6582)
MAELTTTARERLHDASFAYIDTDGDRHLPIHDEEHIRNAISRFDQTDFDTERDRKQAARKIVAAAKRHDIDVDPDDDVAKAANA